MYPEYTQPEDDASEDADDDDDDDSEDDSDDDNNEDSDSHSSDDDNDRPYTAPPRDPVRDQLRQISFGALLDAQHSLPPATVPQIRRHGAPTSDPSAKVNVLRERLAELKALKEKKNSGDASTTTRTSSGNPRSTKPDTRSHKHAPMEQSSKYQVTRKRSALLTSSNPYHARDPRFSAATSGRAADAASIRRNYAFLADYGASELVELKAALKTTRDVADKERLKREITVRESRARAEADKERVRKVVREHRGAQKEAVAQGKKPFFLKQGEIRKRVLVDKFESMKGKEREHAMTRRRKKESQRERRNMPDDRRGV